MKVMARSLGIVLISIAPVWAKPLSDAISTVTDTESTDPNGFKLMIVCIGLLVFLAFTLIGVTIFYFAKQKKKDT
jgi:hypothetical protein